MADLGKHSVDGQGAPIRLHDFAISAKIGVERNNRRPADGCVRPLE
jgi:hypothetical protein